MTGLVSTAISGVTNPWVLQLVDVVGGTILYLNVDQSVATDSIPANADFSCDCTLIHCRMIFTQPGTEVCTTSRHLYTCGHHFCACSSLEAIPAT